MYNEIDFVIKNIRKGNLKIIYKTMTAFSRESNFVIALKFL